MYNTANNNQIPKKGKVVVVGAGLGGLTVAAILAKDDYEVTVIEKTMAIGGRAICKNVGAYTLDSGIHACRGAQNGAANKVLQRLGKEVEFAINNSEGNIPQYFYKNKSADLPTSVAKILTYPLLSFSERLQLLRIFMKISKIKPDGLGDLTVSQWLQQNKINNKNIINHIKAFVGIGYYCYPDLDLILASEFIRFLQKYPYDVGYPKGGWKQMIDKLVQTIKDNGGTIRLGKKVKQVVIKENKAIGVSIGSNGDKGEMEYANNVVLNVPIDTISQLICNSESTLPSFEPSISKNSNESTAAIVLDFVITEENYKSFKVFPKKNDTIVTLEPLVILRCTTKYDNTLAPDGKHIFTTWMPIPSQKITDKEYTQMKFVELEKIIDGLFPSLLSKSIFKRKMVFDSVIGFYPKKGWSLNDRPKVSIDGLSKLYIAGDYVNTHSIGGTSDAAFTSAMTCADLIQKESSS